MEGRTRRAIAHWSNAQIVDALIPPEYRGGQGEFNNANDVDRFIKLLTAHHQRNNIDLGGKPIADNKKGARAPTYRGLLIAGVHR